MGKTKKQGTDLQGTDLKQGTDFFLSANSIDDLVQTAELSAQNTGNTGNTGSISDSNIADTIKSKTEESNKKDNLIRKGFIRKGCGWLKRNYKELIIYNTELIIAEAVSSGTGAAGGELTANYFENDVLVTLGTLGGDVAGCWGAYGFMAYLQRRNAYSSNMTAFAKHMGKFGIAYVLSGIVSTALRVTLNYYLNTEGYGAGEASILAKIPSSTIYIIGMNIIGYKLGIVRDKKTRELEQKDKEESK